MGTVQYRPFVCDHPSPHSVSDYNSDLALFQCNEHELLSPELELDLQEEEQDESNDQIMKSMEQEIECLVALTLWY